MRNAQKENRKAFFAVSASVFGIFRYSKLGIRDFSSKFQFLKMPRQLGHFYRFLRARPVIAHNNRPFQRLLLSHDERIGNLEIFRGCELSGELIARKRLMQGDSRKAKRFHDLQALQFRVKAELQKEKMRLPDADAAPSLSLLCGTGKEKNCSDRRHISFESDPLRAVVVSETETHPFSRTYILRIGNTPDFKKRLAGESS